jgi:hypothetical protein
VESFVLRAVFNGVVVFAAAPRSALERALPDELRLGSNRAPSDWHPVLFIVGDQTRGASRLAGIDLEWGTQYQELVVAVPFVTPRCAGTLGVYAAGMFSSSVPSNWVGTVSYGYHKRPGLLERRGAIYALTTPEDGLVFQATVEPSGPWRRSAEDGSGALSTLRAIAALPWIGRKPNGLYVRSPAKWEFDEACVRPVEAQATVRKPLASGFPTGDYETVRGASVEVRGMVWWLGFPRTCTV